MDNSTNINDIIANLTPDDINMLKGVASSILGEKAGNEPQQSESANNQPLKKHRLRQIIMRCSHLIRLGLTTLTLI